jgi:hypothetical protein
MHIFAYFLLHTNPSAGYNNIKHLVEIGSHHETNENMILMGYEKSLMPTT